MTRRKKTRTLYTPKPPAWERMTRVIDYCRHVRGMPDWQIFSLLDTFPQVLDRTVLELEVVLDAVVVELENESGQDGASKGPGSPPADPETAP